MVAHMYWATPTPKASSDFHYLSGGKRGKAKRRAANKRARTARKASR